MGGNRQGMEYKCQGTRIGGNRNEIGGNGQGIDWYEQGNVEIGNK